MEEVKFDSKVENIKDGGNSLSGGQRKKLMLINLLLKIDASVVIIDEIEAGMDKETLMIWRNIEKKIMEENTNSIIFRISHKEDDYSMYNKKIDLDNLQFKKMKSY
jgi:ABC-type transport system involved in cytochrome bd biosynthesis fused ATPase/permease subunit